MNDFSTTTPQLDSFQSPDPSIATRTIAKRSRASSRGALVTRLPVSDADRVLQFESTLEERVLYLLLARQDTVDIWDQPPAIRYTAPTGHNRSHTFDYLVFAESGQRTAVVVKPHQRAIATAFRKEIAAIRAALRKDFADRMVLITDAHFTRDEALNAQRLHRFRRCITPADNELLCVALDSEHLTFPATVQEIMDVVGLGGRGFQCIFPAFYDGRLVTDLSEEVTLQSRVAQGDAS